MPRRVIGLVTYDGHLAERLSWLRRAAPWVVAGGLIALLLVRYSPSAIARAVIDGDALDVLPWGAMIAFVTLGIMAVADWLVFAPPLGARMSLGAVTRGRAATAMLSAIHIGASGVGYGLWIARRSGAGAGPSVGAVFYQMVSDLDAVLVVALCAALLGPAVLDADVRTAVLVVAGVGAPVVTLALAFGARVAPARLRSAAAAWLAVSAPRLLVSLVLRVASLAVNIAGTWAAARAFGLDLPFWAMAAGLPIVYLVSALPVNIAGLGATSATWVALFQPFAPGAEILAFQFVHQLVTTVMLVARGLPFLPSVSRDLDAR